MIKEKESSPVSEYIRIRKYVFSLAQRAGHEVRKLPSLSGLSKRFGVSRPTVVKALSELVREGELVSKPGIGTFTNPRKINYSSDVLARKSVGLLFGDGMVTFYDNYNGNILASLIKELVDIPLNLHLLNLSSRNPEEMVRDVCNEGVDVLVVHGRNENDGFLRMVAEKGITIIGSELSGNPEFCNVLIDYEGLGERAAELCFAEGRTRIAYLPGGSRAWERGLDGIRRACLKHGVVFNESWNFKQENCIEDLRKMLDFGVVPEAIFINCQMEMKVRAILSEFNIDTREQCRLIQESEAADGSFRYFYDYQKHAHNVGLCLRQALAGEHPSSLVTEWEIKKVGR